MLRRCLDAQCNAMPNLSAAAVFVASAQGLKVALRWPCQESHSSALNKAARTAFERDEPVHTDLRPQGKGGARQVVAMPLVAHGKPFGALVLAFKEFDVPQLALDHLQCVTKALQAALANAPEPVAKNGGPAPPPAMLALECIATLLSHDDVRHAATALASALAIRFQCHRVSIGQVRNGVLRISAVSHRATLAESSGLYQDIATAMEEALAQAAAIVYPATSHDKPRITLAHQALAQRHAASHIYSVPLMREGEVLGVLSLERTDAAPFDQDTCASLEQVAGLIAPVLQIMAMHSRTVPQRLHDGCRAAGAGVFGRTHLLMKASVALVVVIVSALALHTTDYRVTSNARIEGLIQRVVVAPFDGFLKTAHVRPGDTVAEGAALVDLRDEELRLQARKWMSELAQREGAYDEALAKLDRAQLVATNAAIAEARAELELVEQQLERAHLKAPIEGVIIKGDLSQSLGGPVRRGDLLFTIAPSDERRVILEVDERDVGKFQLEQTGELTLSAMPGTPLPIVINRITPVAVVANGGNYFEVQARFAEPVQSMQPGLHGVAKISVGSASALWVLGHRAVEWLRMTWWIWIG